MPPCEGGYKEYKLGDLFSITTSKSVDKKGLLLTCKKNSSIQFIGRTQVDNGVQGYTQRLSFEPNPANTFSIIQVGDSVMQFRESEWYSSQNIFLLKPLLPKLVDAKLYIIGATNKALMIFNGGYNIYPTLEKLKSLYITLPVLDSAKDATCDNIDFQFMESRIRELEEERVRELEVYLSAAGFANCNLTLEEEDALRKFSNGQIIFKKHTIGKLFEKLQIKTTFNKKTDVSSFPKGTHSIPLVNAKHGNNGIMFYGDKNIFSAYEMTLDIVQNGAVATGDVYAQPQPTGVLWDAYLIKNIKHNDTEDSLLFFATIIQKTIKLKYSYDKKATWERVRCDKIDLPITSNGAIDYAFMETYISAIKKQIVQQLKDFIAKEHAAYQQVINA